MFLLQLLNGSFLNIFLEKHIFLPLNELVPPGKFTSLLKSFHNNVFSTYFSFLFILINEIQENVSELFEFHTISPAQTMDESYDSQQQAFRETIQKLIDEFARV